jgi:tetratricopeptide (TPR) repeat protein
LVEAVAQLTRALDLIATLPATPALRREQIKVQVALANALMHTKGFSAQETKAALDTAHSLIERAEALGEPAEDPHLLFSVLYGFWVANQAAFNGEVLRELAAQFLTLAEKQGTAIPLMIGHRLMGTSLLLTGEIATSREHLDCAIALYDPLEHRRLATRFGMDLRVSALTYRSWALWLLGYPQAALMDADSTLKEARDIGQAATLMIALSHIGLTHIFCGNYAAATAQFDELVALADEKSALFRKAQGMAHRGCVLGLLLACDCECALEISFCLRWITGYRPLP